MFKKSKQEELKNDILDSQKRAMRVLAESELVASKVNVALKEQGETIVRVRQVTNNISENLKKTDKDIRVIKSWFGPMVNKLLKPMDKNRRRNGGQGRSGSSGFGVDLFVFQRLSLTNSYK